MTALQREVEVTLAELLAEQLEAHTVEPELVRQCERESRRRLTRAVGEGHALATAEIVEGVISLLRSQGVYVRRALRVVGR